MSPSPPAETISEEEIRSLVSRIVDDVVKPEPVTEAPAVTPSTDHSDARIAMGADHGGYPLKERIAFKLAEAGWEVVDCGTDSHQSVDYPDFAYAVARKVADGECRWGIMIDGAGIGSAMVANKVPGVRAAPCYDLSSARNSREHNHANLLTLGAGLIGENLAWQIVETWLATPWSEGRHANRVAKINAIEQQYSKTQ